MSLPKLNPVEPPWYGPVCPVVGEGWHREVSPYPDHRPFADVIGSDVEAAYRPCDMFDKRRQLMEAWARYIGAAEVLSFPSVRQPA